MIPNANQRSLHALLFWGSFTVNGKNRAFNLRKNKMRMILIHPVHYPAAMAKGRFIPQPGQWCHGTTATNSVTPPQKRENHEPFTRLSSASSYLCVLPRIVLKPSNLWTIFRPIFLEFCFHRGIRNKKFCK